MRLRPTAYSLLLSLLAASHAAAQIHVEERYELGQPIVATADAPEGAALDWRCSEIVTLPSGVEVLGLAEAGVVPVDSSAHVWAKEGRYRLELTVATVVEGRAVLARHTAKFAVGQPAPVPPTPVPPGPTPPVPPTPKPGTLA